MLLLPDEVADCLADGHHGRLQVGHGVAVLTLLVQDDQLAHLHTTGQLVTGRSDGGYCDKTGNIATRGEMLR